MKKSFNLIDKEARQSLALIKLRKKVRFLSFAVVGIFVVVLVIVMGIFLWFKNSIRVNQQKQTSIENEIKSFAKIETLAVVTTQRLKLIDAILKERESYSPMIADLELISVDGFKIDGLTISGDGTIKVTGICNNLESLTNFNNRVEELNDQDKYSQIVYPSVGRSKDGKYTISLELKP